MGTTTVRVRVATRDRLAKIGERRGLTAPELLDELVARAEEEDLLASANEHFAATREQRQEEIAAWDATAADGLSQG